VYIPIAIIAIVLLTNYGIGTFLQVMNIEVQGASLYSEADIIKESGLSLGKNILFVDTGAVSNKIRAAMPFISDVKITRELPDTVLLVISESSAIATLSYKGDTLTIDSAGRVLQRTASAQSGLIEVRGFTPLDPEEGKMMKAELGSETKLQYLTDVLAAIESEGIQSDVSYLDVSNIANITLEYDKKYTVILGGSSDAQYKLDKMISSVITEIEAREPPGTTGTINMSDPSGRWTWNAAA